MYILMNTVKNFTTIHLVLNLIDVLELAILLMTSTCSYKNGKYLASIIDDLAITLDEVKEAYNEETRGN